jgi:RNA polymerase sigma-70 factor, ECF subfamily
MDGGLRQAANSLLQRYLPQLRRWAHGRLPASSRNLLDTWDIVQEVAMSAFLRLSRQDLDRVRALQAYLQRAVLHRIENERRNASGRPVTAPLDGLEIDGGAASPLDEALRKECGRRVRVGLRRLPHKDQMAILARLDGYTYEQIALMLDKPTPEAARQAVARAVARLAEALPAGTHPAARATACRARRSPEPGRS